MQRIYLTNLVMRLKAVLSKRRTLPEKAMFLQHFHSFNVISLLSFLIQGWVTTRPTHRRHSTKRKTQAKWMQLKMNIISFTYNSIFLRDIQMTTWQKKPGIRHSIEKRACNLGHSNPTRTSRPYHGTVLFGLEGSDTHRMTSHSISLHLQACN